MKMSLSPKQLQIVEASDKYIYVIAGAGSGKTRTLTERIIKILSQSKRGEKVLAITFSNKAANELEDRLLRSFSQDQLNDLVYVGTVHNFCMEIILQRGSAIGLPDDLHIFESFEDRFTIFKAALDNVPQMKTKYQSYDGKINSKEIRKIFESLSKAKRNFKFPSDYTPRSISQRLYQEYNDLMLSQNAIDFDDILLYAYRIMVEKPSIAKIYQRIYKYICVDEAQDLNKAQYSVIKAIAGDSASIFMVGDPNQAIYGFNGSSSHYMCSDFPKDYAARKYELLDNYRSSQAIIDAAKVIEPSFEMEGRLPIKGKLEVRVFDDELSEATWISNKINELLQNGHPDIEGGKILPQQCAVLARNRYVFNALTKLFDVQGREYNLRVSVNQALLSESVFFKLFDLGLRVIMNKNDALHLSDMSRLINGTADNILTFEELRASQYLVNAIGEKGRTIINSAWDSIQLPANTFRFNKVLAMLSSYCEDEGNFLDDNERSLVYNDCLSWQERWNVYVKNSSIEDRSLAHMMRSIALGITNIAKESGITLSTVHMSKGLEFDVVFVMGLNEGVFPDYRALDNVAQLDEEQHNMFVSITRSKRLCYLSYPQMRVMPWGGSRRQQPSRYVAQLSEQ
ncbi:ATP-dependent helicase [Synergistaceae bacterium OttesenSCG-928-D05]|nr:ATP-dependent helicase [Synergistaceae bacterium OttesenSCG-928-D05]